MPISRPHTGEELEEEQIRMNFSTIDKTVLVPEGREGAESIASPIKFTEELQNGATLKIKPQEQSLLWTLHFEAQDREVPDPDFYMPRGLVSHIKCIQLKELLKIIQEFW